MIYLDYAATAPMPRAAADAMYAVLTEQYGNPSAQYPFGLAGGESLPPQWAVLRSGFILHPAARKGITGPFVRRSGRTGTRAGIL